METDNQILGHILLTVFIKSAKQSTLFTLCYLLSFWIWTGPFRFNQNRRVHGKVSVREISLANNFVKYNNQRLFCGERLWWWILSFQVLLNKKVPPFTVYESFGITNSRTSIYYYLGRKNIKISIFDSSLFGTNLYLKIIDIHLRQDTSTSIAFVWNFEY